MASGPCRCVRKWSGTFYYRLSSGLTSAGFKNGGSGGRLVSEMGKAAKHVRLMTIGAGRLGLPWADKDGLRLAVKGCNSIVISPYR